VRSLSNSASNEKVDTGGNILIHHSRNTAQKQWAETQVSNVCQHHFIDMWCSLFSVGITFISSSKISFDFSDVNSKFWHSADAHVVGQGR
jgi:hypothetical protein